MASYSGPVEVDCAEACEVPEGVILADVPPPRHAWNDVLACPNDGCGRCFLIVAEPLVEVEVEVRDE